MAYTFQKLIHNRDIVDRVLDLDRRGYTYKLIAEKIQGEFSLASVPSISTVQRIVKNGFRPKSKEQL